MAPKGNGNVVGEPYTIPWDSVVNIIFQSLELLLSVLMLASHLTRFSDFQKYVQNLLSVYTPAAYSALRLSMYKHHTSMSFTTSLKEWNRGFLEI